jgi:hypothetical protein
MSPEESKLAIDGILADKTLQADPRLKNEVLLRHMVSTLAGAGELLEVQAGNEGRVPAFLESATGKLCLIVPDNRDARQLLKKWFGWPAHFGWDEKLGMDLDGSGLLLRAQHRLSHYDAAQHVLYLNEWNGGFLRIDGEGRISRHVNGADGVLFLEAQERAHSTDIAAAQAYKGKAWHLGKNSGLVKHIFDVVTFDGNIGLDRETAHGILMGFLLAMLFRSRVQTLPILHFHSGVSGTKKTAAAVAIGWVLFGMTFKATACPEDKKEAENILLNSPGYVVLDESNKMYLLQDMLKAIVTGAILKRREYFTTAQEEEYAVETGAALTTNSLSVTEDALIARIFQLTVVAGSKEWKSEFQITEEWRTENLRAVLWVELVGRASAAMREITRARATGNEHLTVTHRMSSFWVFLRMLARQEGCEAQLLTSIDTVSGMQTSTMESQDDIAPLFERLKQRKGYLGKWMSASEWGEALKLHAPYGGLPPQLAKLVASSARLSNRMEQSAARLGIEVRNTGRVKEYRIGGDSGTDEASLHADLGSGLTPTKPTKFYNSG